MVFFEAPHRLAATLHALAEGLAPERRAAVCRELTKTYEEVRRGSLEELAAWADTGVRGEITVVVAGIDPEAARLAAGLADPSGWVEAVAEAEAGGLSRKEAIADVARRAGVARRLVFDAVVRDKHARP